MIYVWWNEGVARFWDVIVVRTSSVRDWTRGEYTIHGMGEDSLLGERKPLDVD